jgi:hypothetical protein
MPYCFLLTVLLKSNDSAIPHPEQFRLSRGNPMWLSNQVDIIEKAVKTEVAAAALRGLERYRK